VFNFVGNVIIGSVLILVTFSSCARAGIVFQDDFNTFDQTVWGSVSGTVPVSSGFPQIISANVFQGQTNLEMISLMQDYQLRGIETLTSFSNSDISLTVNFMPLSGGIDGALQVWLISNIPGKNFIMQVFGGDFGASRFVATEFDAISPGRPSYRVSPFGIWNYNNWYTFKINATTDSLIASFLQGDQTIYQTQYNMGLSDLGTEYSIALTQNMLIPGTPSLASVRVADVTLDAVPEPTTVTMLATSLPLGLGFWFWKRRRAAA
jgi:hypothetical protein